MTRSPSLAGRAALAVVLMIGFYLLALAIAGGLLWLVYAEVAYAHRFHVKLTICCILGAGAILWSVPPRFDKFRPPGPLLTRDQHPRLFGEIESISQSVNQTMPVEDYLVPDVNAWVAQRGGVMGFGSRRVMGLPRWSPPSPDRKSPANSSPSPGMKWARKSTCPNGATSSKPIPPF